MALKFARPINTGGKPANISTPFGPNHPGIDYAYPEGTNVYASEDGTVTIAKDGETRQWIANTSSDPYRIKDKTRALKTEDYGNFIKIQHDPHLSSLYAHLKVNSLIVKVGDVVKKGQLIAQVGSTGNSTGNHTHWETDFDNEEFDPSTMFDSGFTNYSDKKPAAQVAVDADVFPRIIHNSTEWEKTSLKYLPDKNPKDTSAEDLDRVVNGYKSRETDLNNQLTDAIKLQKSAEQEVINQKEKVANIQSQCQVQLDLKEAQIKALKEASPANDKLIRQMEGTITALQLQLREEQKQHGITKLELTNVKTALERANKGEKALTLFEQLLRLLGVKFK